MNMETLTALTFFALVASITPGPNNLMLMASGANFGFRRTLPHMLGIGTGFVFMLILVGLGLSRIFEAFPISQLILKVLSIGFMLFLAYKIATSAPPAKTAKRSAPLSFLQAALFQWVNPKAWAMALGAISLYAPGKTTMEILIVGLVFGLVNFPCISSWTILGQQMRHWLNSPFRLRIFNGSMAALLVASLYPVLM